MKINGREYAEIKKIIVYGHGEKLFEQDANRIAQYTTDRSGHFSSVYASEIVNINLAGEIKNARKENLNRGDNYLLPFWADYSWNSGKALYIHESEVHVESLGERLAMEHDGEKDYIRAYSLHFANGAEYDKLCAEKIECDGNWKLPVDKCWSWGSGYGRGYNNARVDTYDTTQSPFAQRRGVKPSRGVLVRWIETAAVSQIETAVGPYCRIEKNDSRKSLEKIAADFERITGKSFYFKDIEKLMEKYDISEKH